MGSAEVDPVGGPPGVLPPALRPHGPAAPTPSSAIRLLELQLTHGCLDAVFLMDENLS